jgi:hypothetical protein
MTVQDHAELFENFALDNEGQLSLPVLHEPKTEYFNPCILVWAAG